MAQMIEGRDAVVQIGGRQGADGKQAAAIRLPFANWSVAEAVSTVPLDDATPSSFAVQALRRMRAARKR